MTVATAAPERFDIGRVFSGGFEIVGRRPMTLIAIVALFGFLPAAATFWLTNNWAPQPTPGDIGATFGRLGIAELIAIAFGGFGWVLQGAMAAAALSGFGDRPLSFGETLARTAPRLPLVYVMGVLSTGAILLGSFALVVPGLLLSLAWAVGGVVATVENTGFRAFGRSAELTRGNRANLFVILLVYGLAYIVVSFTVRSIAGVGLAARGADPLWLTIGLQPLANAVVQLFSASTLVAAYVELRGVKDGLAAASLASLFD